MVDAGERDTHLVQDPQDSVAAAGVYHEIFVAVSKCKASIIKIRRLRVAGSEYIKNLSVHEKNSPFRQQFFYCLLNMNMLL